MPSLPFAEGVVLSTVSRSGRVESCHRGAVAVWHEDAPWLRLGDAEAPVICRSATKPLQALPFLERGLDRQLGIDDAELVVQCASHDGTERHTAAVRRLLARGGLAEDLLGCGPHAPFDAAARRALAAAGERPQKVHNNCSGKHAGFLHLARACGDPLERYLDPASAAQTEVARAVAAMAGVDLPVERGVDGCGAPTFVLPLLALARAFARLANPDGLPPVRAAACRRIVQAAGQDPEMMAGKKRLCAALLRAAPGTLLPKNGAEGVYAVALLPDARRRACPGPVGIAVKVHDGSTRGYEAVVVDLLLHLGCFGGAQMAGQPAGQPADQPADLPADLRAFHRAEVANTRGEVVGEVRCAVDWRRS